MKEKETNDPFCYVRYALQYHYIVTTPCLPVTSCPLDHAAEKQFSASKALYFLSLSLGNFQVY